MMQTPFEQLKYISDYFIHLTTLSTWAILLIAAFLEKLFIKPKLKGELIGAIVCFMCCVFSSVAFQTIFILRGGPSAPENPMPVALSLMGVVFGMGSIISFFFGVVLLGLFTIGNLRERLRDDSPKQP